MRQIQRLQGRQVADAAGDRASQAVALQVQHSQLLELADAVRNVAYRSIWWCHISIIELTRQLNAYRKENSWKCRRRRAWAVDRCCQGGILGTEQSRVRYQQQQQ